MLKDASPVSLSDVVRHGLCVGCGLCESLGGARLPMRLNEEGNLRPSVPPDLEPELEARVLASCPGLVQEGPETPRRSAVWGPYRSINIGHALDEELRFSASSGGVTSAAACFLLDRDRADVVLHVATDQQNPLRSMACASRSAGEVRSRVGARYGPAAPLRILRELLDAGERIVVLAKPCDIAGVRNLARLDPRVDRQVVATISFFCAGLPSLDVSRAIIAKYGLVESEIALLRYRGMGCPGPTRIEARDGRAFEQTYQETWSSDLTRGVQFRCKICPDSTGEQADLVAGDAWAGGEGNPLDDSAGHNLVIARSERGQALLEDMIAAGVLAVEAADARDLEAMQPNHARRKRQLLARLAGLLASGEPMPRYSRLGLARAALSGIAGWSRSMRGTLARVRNGNNREHLPDTAPAEFEEAGAQQ